MNARTKLRWVDIPRHSLREGLACAHGGVQIVLMTGDESPSVIPSADTSPLEAQSEARPGGKPR